MPKFWKFKGGAWLRVPSPLATPLAIIQPCILLCPVLVKEIRLCMSQLFHFNVYKLMHQHFSIYASNKLPSCFSIMFTESFDFFIRTASHSGTGLFAEEGFLSSSNFGMIAARLESLISARAIPFCWKR